MDEGQKCEMNGDGYRDLAAAVVLRAIRDVKAEAGNGCNGQCRPERGYHVCALSAWVWLDSPEGRGLCELLGLDADAVLETLGPEAGG